VCIPMMVDNYIYIYTYMLLFHHIPIYILIYIYRDMFFLQVYNIIYPLDHPHYIPLSPHDCWYPIILP
jgi:hypothetical protein